MMQTTPHDGHATHSSDRALWSGVVLILVFTVVEAVGGWWAGSLALLGDAGHMLTDATALSFAALAVWVARQPPTESHSFGLARAEVVAALINGLFMLIVVISIAYHAVDRLLSPRPVAALAVIIVAALGLVVNVLIAWMLHHGEQNLNTRAAMLHVLGDLLGSAAALLAGIIIYFTGWLPIDPLLSMLICVLILISSVRLLRDVLHVILEAVPRHIDLQDVATAMAAVASVESVHDLHIWTLSSGHLVLSAHVSLADIQQWQKVCRALQQLLAERFGIEHVTLQPETGHTTDRPVLCSKPGSA